MNEDDLKNQTLDRIDQRVKGVFKESEGGDMCIDSLVESTDFNSKSSIMNFVNNLFYDITNLTDNLDYLKPIFTVKSDGIIT